MGRMEKSWLTVAFVWCVFLTVMMPLWYFYGKQNVPTETYKTSPADYGAKVNAFVEQYTIGTDEATGFPIVAPPPGSDVYIRASTWQWYPVLQLEKGQEYLNAVLSDYSRGVKNSPDVLGATIKNLEFRKRFAELRRDYMMANARIEAMLAHDH